MKDGGRGRFTLQRVTDNSHVEVYLDLTVLLVEHNPLGVTSSRDLVRDIETIKSRYRDEGLSFLSKALPSLGKALDRGLIEERFSLPRGWKHQHGVRSRPAFMQAYFNLIFDEHGNLLAEASPDAIKHLRQVCFAMYKLMVPYQRKEELDVIQSFVSTDSVLQFDCADTTVSPLLEAASVIAGDILMDFDPKDIIPRHGPGAVATGERLDAKWRFCRLYNKLHQQYPYYDYFVVGGARELADRLDWYNSLERLETGTAKVVLVPKDSRGPRLISAEPLEYQWIQQGIGRKLVAHLESSWITRGRINFTHQNVNQELALSSSITREFATLDLKDASDRVSLQLVQAIFKDCPEFLAAIESARTTATKLPDGSILKLNKFAPMGSALCFPVEALCFWVLMVAAVHVHLVSEARKSSLSRVDAVALVDVRNIGKRMFVYGDDLVVPTEWAYVCIHALEAVNLRVNVSKSCITGFFRESCGVDAYKGVNVTPLRFKALWSGQPSDGTALASYVALYNAFALRGYTGVSSYLLTIIERTYGKLPWGTSESSYPCRIVDDPWTATVRNRGLFKSRYRSDFHRLEFRVSRIVPTKRDTELESWPRLLRNLVSGEIVEPSKIVVPRSIRIKRGWAPVF